MGSINTTFSTEELRELADFWSPEAEAITVYFQPPVPTELAHREEPILVKNNLREQLNSLKGAGPADRSDIQRIMDTIARMQGNEHRSKVIFACTRHNIWREYNISGDFGVRVETGNAFAITPLIAQQQARRRYCIALADRNRARLLLLESRTIAEHSQVLDEEKEKIRTTGTGKSAHLERQKEEQVRRHFAFLANHLLHFYQHGDYNGLVIGCRDEMWPEIEAELHPEIKRILVGHFHADPGFATKEEILSSAQSLVDAKEEREQRDILQRAIGGAASDRLGAVGLPAVAEALEKGEVWTLIWPQSRPSQHGAETPAALLCPNCGHLDTGTARACTLCGAEMRRFSPPEEGLVRHALGRSIDVRSIPREKLPPAAEVAATLRFRAGENTPQKLAS